MFWGKQRSTSSPSRLCCSFFFSCECPKFCDLAKQRRKIFLGVSEVGKIDFALFFFWLCVFFLVFFSSAAIAQRGMGDEEPALRCRAPPEGRGGTRRCPLGGWAAPEEQERVLKAVIRAAWPEREQTWPALLEGGAVLRITDADANNWLLRALRNAPTHWRYRRRNPPPPQPQPPHKRRRR